MLKKTEVSLSLFSFNYQLFGLRIRKSTGDKLKMSLKKTMNKMMQSMQDIK
jgi:hypothetical protein